MITLFPNAITLSSDNVISDNDITSDNDFCDNVITLSLLSQLRSLITLSITSLKEQTDIHLVNHEYF